jgi:hypothetical protein
MLDLAAIKMQIESEVTAGHMLQKIFMMGTG